MFPKPNGTIVAVLMAVIFFVSGCGGSFPVTTGSGVRIDIPMDLDLENKAALDTSSNMVAATESNEQVELGQVQWGRDIELAKKQSAESGKPVLILFQEVPG